MIHARDDYNRIQDPAGLIPADEPVFLLRAQDQLACMAVAYYASLCEQAQSPDIAALARSHANRMAAWPKKKVPDLPDGAAQPQQATALSKLSPTEDDPGVLWAEIARLCAIMKATAEPEVQVSVRPSEWRSLSPEAQEKLMSIARGKKVGELTRRIRRQQAGAKEFDAADMQEQWTAGFNAGREAEIARENLGRDDAQPQQATGFNPAADCSPFLTQCPRCNNPNGVPCDGGRSQPQQAKPLRRGTTGVCSRNICECEREGFGDQCVWLRPVDEPLIDGYPLMSGLPPAAQAEPVAWRWKERINDEFDSGWRLTSFEPPTGPRTIAVEPLYNHHAQPRKRTEQDAWEDWAAKVGPSGDVDEVQRKWLASTERAEFMDEDAQPQQATAHFPIMLAICRAALSRNPTEFLVHQVTRLAEALSGDEKAFIDDLLFRATNPSMQTPAPRVVQAAQPQQATADPDDQEWDRNAERITQEVFGSGKGINPHATSVDDLFLDDDPDPPNPEPQQDGAKAALIELELELDQAKARIAQLELEMRKIRPSLRAIFDRDLWDSLD